FMLWQEKSVLFNEGRNPPAKNSPWTRYCNRTRDWGDYAQRTARYAYSAAGDRQAAELGKYRQQWEKLEGREQVQKVQEKVQKIERDNTPGMSR
ncbi:hypothetical protein AAKU58_004313, partial [Oxalobacteraceae bacterium GrIS 1.18]